MSYIFTSFTALQRHFCCFFINKNKPKECSVISLTTFPDVLHRFQHFHISKLQFWYCDFTEMLQVNISGSLNFSRMECFKDKLHKDRDTNLPSTSPKKQCAGSGCHVRSVRSGNAPVEIRAAWSRVFSAEKRQRETVMKSKPH